MVERPSSAFEFEVILDYMSALGPNVTHMRGTLLVNSLDNLRALGLYDRYLGTLPASHQDVIPYTIAASWIPIDIALLHYETCDAMGLSEEQLAKMGTMMATRVAETFLATVLRTTRNAGVEAFWSVLKQNHRLLERMYQGGGMSVLKTGPKDLVLENTGLPVVASRYWRRVYVYYMQAIGNMFTKVTYVKLVRPRVSHPHSIAIACSWV
ncbi:MAG: hypothetical protein RLZZ450_7247 [Pseudomonadota bacterium]|jgi:hypothetical protein